jgi:hypothetical protein
MAHVVVTFNTRDVDRATLRQVLAGQINYERRQRRRIRDVRWCAVAGGIALACWRSGLWAPAPLLLLVSTIGWCIGAYAAEWYARLRLDALLARIPATWAALPQIGNQPTVP